MSGAVAASHAAASTGKTHYLAEDDDAPTGPKHMSWKCHEFLAGTIRGQVIVLILGAVQLNVGGAVAWGWAGGNDLYDSSWPQCFWFSWGMFFDPGTEMGFAPDDRHWNKALAVTFSVLGFIYNLLLLGLLVEQARRVLEIYYARGNRVVANGHTLVLGWSEHVLFMLNELVHAGEGRQAKNQIVILAQQDEDFMQQRIQNNFPKRADLKGQRVCVFRGSPFEVDDLSKVSAKSAREVICLGESEDPGESDQECLQMVCALASLPEEPHGNIIASVADPDAAPVIDAILARAEGVVTRELIDRMMCLTVLRPTLGSCFEQLSSFTWGEEMYCKTLPALGLDLRQCPRFGDVHEKMARQIVVGIKHPRKGDGKMRLSIAPRSDHRIAEHDELVVIASSDRRAHSVAPSAGGEDPCGLHILRTTPTASVRAAGSTIILVGWSSKMLHIVETLGLYVDGGAEVHILAEVDADEQRRLLKDCVRHKIKSIEHYCGDRTCSACFDSLPLSRATAVLILADRAHTEANTSDSSCLACAVTLVGKKDAYTADPPHLVCELLSSRTQRMLARHETLRGEITFFQTSAVESGVIVMASASRAVYNSLLALMEPDGPRLACKPAGDYIVGASGAVTFNSLARRARERGQILAGYKRAAGADLCLNPADRDTDLKLQRQDELILVQPRE